MSHDPAAWSALQQARADLAAKRAATVQQMSDPTAIVSARAAERQARAAVAVTLAQWLDQDPAADVRTMSAQVPIALFPVRIETRFDPPLAPTTLKVRIYPDTIQSLTHQVELADSEARAGDRFWSDVGGGLDRAEAWRRLLVSLPAPRAAYVVAATDPSAVRPPLRPSTWTRPAEARLLPDRWIVAWYRDGHEIGRVAGPPIVEPLALTIGPTSGASGDASLLGADPDLGWAVDFQAAVAAGMAVSIPLTAADAQIGFDRLIVVGVKASLDALSTTAAVADLWRAHAYSDGVAFVAQGTPTNNTGDAPAAYPPDDPNGAVSYALQFQSTAPAPGADGQLFMTALGLPADLAAAVAGASGLEQTASHAMNRVLWPITWGYYLRELFARGVDPNHFGPMPIGGTRTIADIMDAARDHFVAYVRGRGPLPAFRVGATPYGLLPVTSLDHWIGPDTVPTAAFDLLLVQSHSGSGTASGWDDARIGRSLHVPRATWDVVAALGTPLPCTNDAYAYLAAAFTGGSVPDLMAVRKTGGASGRTEFAILSGRSRYRNIVSQGATALGPTADQHAFAAGDWDGDGKPDLIVVNRQGATSTEFTILSGASNFTVAIATGATALPKTDETWQFAAGDWDGDGKPDLFAVQTLGAASHHVEVHILSGASQFKTEILKADTGVPEIAQAVEVSVVDWDGDGRLDVVLLQRGAPQLLDVTATIVSGANPLNTTLPAVQASVPEADPPTGLHLLAPAAEHVLAADWDGDSRGEILVVRSAATGSGGIEVTIASGSPVTEWTTPIRWTDPSHGARRVMAIAVGDANGTGDPALVVVQTQMLPLGALGVFYRIGRKLDALAVPSTWSPDAGLSAAANWPLTTVGAGVALSDLDGDGRPELILFHADASSPTTNQLGTYRVGSKLDDVGNVAQWSGDIPVPGVSGLGTRLRIVGASMTLADLDGNGRPDMIVAVITQVTLPLTVTSMSYVVGKNLDPAGRAAAWGSPIALPRLSPPPARDVSIAVGDIDGDGHLDLVVSYVESNAAGNYTWYRIGRQLDPSGKPLGGWTDGVRVADRATAATNGGIALVRATRGLWTGFLRSLREVWRRGVPQARRLANGGDDAALISSLAVDASAREVGIRRALGPNALWNLFTLLGTQGALQSLGMDWNGWYAQIQRRALDVMRTLGDPAFFETTGAVAWHPRLVDSALEGTRTIFNQPLVAPSPLSESAPLDVIHGIPNYLTWLSRLPPVPPNPSQPSLQTAAGSDVPWPLLYYLVRHALLTEYAEAAFQIDVQNGASNSADDHDPELVGILPNVPVRTVWNRLTTPVPIAGGTGQTTPMWVQLFGGGTGPAASVREHRDRIDFLSRLSTAELDRLLSETLDVCSHRIDAWITSLATRRLQTELRSAPPGRVYAGGFGWLEDVRPTAASTSLSQTIGGQQVLVQPAGGGYVHAPSLSAASAAAVLRNAHMSRGGGSTVYAINLSSARVRAAEEVLDAIRDGVSLPAALGYRVERILQDHNLQRYIDPFRHLFPAVPLQQAATTAAPGSTAGRTLLDGLALRAAWPNLPWGQGDLPNVAQDQQELQQLRQLLDGELGHATASTTGPWLDPLDAVADLLTAESVHQIVRGNPTGAVAALDALGQSARPPEPAIVRTPRHGIPLTHRIAMVLGDPAPALTDWPAATPRALADPYLDAWVGSLIGDPAQAQCTATAGTTTIDITLADLGMRPLDILALARTLSGDAGGSELDRRVMLVAAERSGAASIAISYQRSPTWPAGVRSFGDVLELASAINQLLGHARPLQPDDLLPPESVAIASSAVPNVADARARAQAARGELASALSSLTAAAAATAPDVASLRAALLAISLYDLPAAVPPPASGSQTAAFAALVSHAQSIAANAAERIAAADAALSTIAALAGSAAVDAARAAVRAIFGRDVPFLVAFAPAEVQPGDLARALAASSSLLGNLSSADAATTLRGWLMSAARVRGAVERWRRLSLDVTALGRSADAWTVAQLPYLAGDSWVGLPFTTNRPAAGRVSLVLNMPVAPAAGSTWAGLLIDEWTELIPSATAPTGLAFHYQTPHAQAPQTVLLAVPPSTAGSWDLDVLLSIVNETLDLAAIRTLDGAAIGSTGQMLPAIALAFNASGDTVSTDFSRLRRTE